MGSLKRRDDWDSAWRSIEYMQYLEANPVAAYCTEDTGDIKVVKGGADRALGSFADKSNTGDIPLIMEAKPDGSATMDIT